MFDFRLLGSVRVSVYCAMSRHVHTHPQDMLQDEAQRGAARVRQVEDEMGAVYETLNERDATIKNMQVRKNIRAGGRRLEG
jgi:hypothetical protein